MDLRNYCLVTAAYWGFTLTDGALRTLVLLHFHQLGFTPVQLAFLFLLYECAGIITNLFGGWLAYRHGLRPTLLVGLALQVVMLGALSLVSDAWALPLSVAFVMACQAGSGVAKDLTKMSAKSAIKTLVPDDQQNALFRWVAVLTGSKNALKGVGFFLGALLLSLIGFQWALWSMAGALALILIGSWISLPVDLGRAKPGKGKPARLLAKSRGLNLLSAARMFLFGARDVWFVVGVPIALSENFGWDFWQVGAFLGAWIIGYGIVQSAAPGMLKRSLGGDAPGPGAALALVVLLAATAAAIPLLLLVEVAMQIVIIGGLAVFGLVFALNSSVHSYLVLAYTTKDEVAADVGFYYASNAGGRLLGTLASGLLATWWSDAVVQACMWGAVVFLLPGIVFTVLMPPPVRTVAIEDATAA